MDVADTIAKRSKCSRAQVGAVIVDSDQNILAAAYNGPAPGWTAWGSAVTNCAEWCPRAQGIGGTTSDYSNCPSNHAEINAIARMAPTTRKTIAYVNRLCCFTCTKALAAAKVSRVVCKKTDLDDHINEEMIREYLENCKIELWRI